mgnify:CR=1 FL=1
MELRGAEPAGTQGEAEAPGRLDHGVEQAGAPAAVVAAGRGDLVRASVLGLLGTRGPSSRADIAFVSNERLPAGGRPKGYFPGAPDLAVEVLSPSNTLKKILLSWPLSEQRAFFEETLGIPLAFS